MKLYFFSVIARIGLKAADVKAVSSKVDLENVFVLPLSNPAVAPPLLYV